MSQYMPRRTSEFRGKALEERGTADKRQTRATKRSVASHTPSSSQVVAPRRPSASRLPQPLNLERDRFTQMSVTPKHGSRPMSVASRVSQSQNLERDGPSSQVTPKHGHRPAPFTAERPVAPHSDKKWVAERAQQILGYLQDINDSMATTLPISDLFYRAGGLRHMTIKQFVAILNFLFHHIWRNKVTVGQNHVEDITSAMQKLQYPYQVNKSWLVSPTTSHSFGHVIVLLDFLMDFVPSSEESFLDFPFTETTEQPSSYLHSVHCETMATITTTTAQMQAVQLDEEVNALLFAETSKCIDLWDKELSEEEAKLQADTRDKLIAKKCDLPDRQALDQVIDDLRAKLQQLEDRLQHPSDGSKPEQLEHLAREQKQLAQQLADSQEELKQQQILCDKLAAQAEEKQANLRQQIKYEQRLEQVVSGQKYTAQQLNTLQLQSNDVENYSKAYERQVKEVSDLELHLQVMLSRAKQKLLDCVEAFNSHAHHLAGDPAVGGLMKRSGDQQFDLTLPFNPKPEDISKRVQCLDLLNNLLQQQRQRNVERRQMLDQQVNKAKCDFLKLDAEVANLESRLQAQKHLLAKVEAGYRTKCDMITQHRQQLAEDRCEQIARLEELEKRQQEAEAQLQESVQKNEDLLAGAELLQEEDHKARHARLDECELKLAEAEKELQALDSKLTVSRAQLEADEQKVYANPLPSFEPVLQAFKRR
ncbi:myosin-11 [Drosophila biarmipes]|uniref:myosin-11 n=1 Tax=Drosophila biarmipes TaxID=125945 RepID=UPI0007E6A643|nr:myosin-11 [Drosophila biarmipes]